MYYADVPVYPWVHTHPAGIVYCAPGITHVLGVGVDRLESSKTLRFADGFGQHWVNGGRGGGGGVEPRRQHVAVPARVHVLALALLC